MSDAEQKRGLVDEMIRSRIESSGETEAEAIQSILARVTGLPAYRMTLQCLWNRAGHRWTHARFECGLRSIARQRASSSEMPQDKNPA
jgi:hypothetical protein